jgi:hypothetical protein
MQTRTNQGDQEVAANQGTTGGALLWWHAQDAPPVCPTCRTFCRCRRTILKEDARVQYRYCETCDYKTKTIVAVGPR